MTAESKILFLQYFVWKAGGILTRDKAIIIIISKMNKK